MTFLLCFHDMSRRAESMTDNTEIKKKKSLKLEKWVRAGIQNKGNKYI